MNPQTVRCTVGGPGGLLECAIDEPHTPARGVAVLCHPHPQHGGTMDNKVVQTLARAMVQLSYTSVRFNFRGVGRSEGTWDHGQGEVQDALAVIAAQAGLGHPLVLGGFSFGAYVATQAAARLPAVGPARRLVLVGPAAVNFELAAVPPDTLVVHGERDEIVPLQAVFDWARPLALPITVLPGAGHFFHGQLTVLKTIVLRAWGAQPS